jgi:hypothetical protein
MDYHLEIYYQAAIPNTNPLLPTKLQLTKLLQVIAIPIHNNLHCLLPFLFAQPSIA